jgi:hypothetical protein
METTMLSTIRIAAAVATAAVLLSATGGAQAASRGPSGGGFAPIKAAPAYRGYGWGYGRGWCYWHPYACAYRR